MTAETPSEHALKLLTVAQYHRMLANGRWNAAHVAKDGNTDDLAPVVKLFCPWGGGTWLLTELDPEDPDIAFGLFELGMGLSRTRFGAPLRTGCHSRPGRPWH